MDRFEGRCWLDWWANASTLFDSLEVAVVITTGDAGWDAHGRLTSGADEDRDGFASMVLPPPAPAAQLEETKPRVEQVGAAGSGDAVAGQGVDDAVYAA